LTYEFFILLTSPVHLRRGSERVAWWASGSQPRSTCHNDSVSQMNCTLELPAYSRKGGAQMASSDMGIYTKVIPSSTTITLHSNFLIKNGVTPSLFSTPLKL